MGRWGEGTGGSGLGVSEDLGEVDKDGRNQVMGIEEVIWGGGGSGSWMRGSE